MQIPKKIKIGGLIYQVFIVNKVNCEDTAGEIDTPAQMITLAKGKPDFMYSTLLHEILHAINMELKETDVEFFAQALYQVIKENPEVFNYDK